jgi:hypothetical protein
MKMTYYDVIDAIAKRYDVPYAFSDNAIDFEIGK